MRHYEETDDERQVRLIREYELITLSHAAMLHHECSTEHLRQLIKRDELDTIDIGTREIYITRESLRRHMERGCGVTKRVARQTGTVGEEATPMPIRTSLVPDSVYVSVARALIGAQSNQFTDEQLAIIGKAVIKHEVANAA